MLHSSVITTNNGTGCSKLLELGGLKLQVKDRQLNAKMLFQRHVAIVKHSKNIQGYATKHYVDGFLTVCQLLMTHDMPLMNVLSKHIIKCVIVTVV